MNYSPLATKVKAEELGPIDRKVEEIKKTSTYEEKKITLKIKRNVPEPKRREKIDFEILVDASGSMRDSGSIPKTKEVLKNFIASRNPNYDRISITTFRGPGYFNSGNAKNYPMYIKTIHEMDNKFEDAINTIDALSEAPDESNKDFGGFTPLLDGLNKSKSNLDNAGSTADRKVLIILGDGHPNVGPERDHYYKEKLGNYYGNYPNNYPGYETQKELDILNAKVNNGEIEYDEYLNLSDPLYATLTTQEALYPGATEVMLTDKYAAQTQKDLKGTIYDNSKPEFYDLRYLVMEKVNEIKDANYEVFSVFLDNEKSGADGTKGFLINTNENEKLFKEIAKDDKHYFYSQNINELPQAFEDVKKVINTFDYFVNDTIEDGFELMPDTFKASQNGVIPKVDGKNITWDVSGVPYNELEVSYHIKREIPSGDLKVRYVDEATGKDIIDPILSTEPLDQDYTTEKKVLPGYEYVKVVGNETGKYVTGTTEVTYYYSKLATLGDKVWLDKNNDGIQDATELGLKNITVKLTDSKGNTITTTTNDNGNYIFDRLTPDKYTISIDQTTLPKNMEETFEKDNSKDNKVDVDLTAGQVIDDVDFGYKVKQGTLVVKYLEEGTKTKNTTEVLPKTGSAIPHAPYFLGLLSVALGLHMLRRKQ